MSGTGSVQNPSGLTVRAIALVFVGGAVGTTVRAAVDGAVGGVALNDPGLAPVGSATWGDFLPAGATLHEFPLHTFTINVVGSLLLGVLLERLGRRGPLPTRTRLRLLLGTGALGGFTTYSALTVTTAQLLRVGSPTAAAVYALATVLLGLVAAGAGIALSARLSRGAGQTSVVRREDESDEAPRGRP